MPLNLLRSRAGLSLAEVIVVISLLGLVGAAMGSAIQRQQRFHRHASAVLDARQGVRDAMEVLSGDIRGSSPADTIRLMADSALELFTTIGTAVACRSLAGTSVFLAAESATGNTLTSFLVAPDTGDLALVFTPTGDATVGSWGRYRVAGFGGRASRPGCFGDQLLPTEGFLLTLQSLPNPPIRPGSFIRFIRRGRYSLYRASDGQWYLGYRRCNALGLSGCGAIQPLSGPYKRYSPDKTETGFLFEYFDASGERMSAGSSPLSVTRIDITARADKAPARAESALPESATVSIALRNR